MNTGLISNSHSPMSMNSLHNGLPSTPGMMSSSTTTSSSSSPRQPNGYPPETSNTNGYHHDSNMSLPTTGRDDMGIDWDGETLNMLIGELLNFAFALNYVTASFLQIKPFTFV